MNNEALQGLRTLLSLLNQPAVNSEVDRLFRGRNPSTSTNSISTATITATVPAVTVSAAAGTSSVTVASTTVTVVPTAPAFQAPNVRNIGPLFNPATFLTANRGRGRGCGGGRRRTAPYISPGPVFTRLVVLLSGPGVEGVPKRWQL